MKKQNEIHQQSILDSNGLLPKKTWKAALLHVAILIAVVFLTEISAARADMVFDFQMKLAQKGNAEAQFKVGEMYEAGRGVEKDMEQAMSWVTRAAEQGNKAANYKLLYYDLEKNSLNTANKAQLDELIKAANAGDGYAQYYIGMMHSRGVGLSKNSTQALDWLSKASLVGITAAETEIMHINETNQHKQSPAHKKKQLEVKPAGQTNANQQQKQQQKSSAKDEIKHSERAAASRKKTEAEKKVINN
ncbi:MAG: tetratricopeptide repeat protein [Gammaproteobacteria bacterium]|jgi:hypothetical protein